MAGAAGSDGRVLRGAPVVDVANLVYTADGAVGSAGFFGEEFALDDLGGVVGDRNARVAALLRAVADDPVLVDVEIARARSAAPVVRLAIGDGLLEAVEARVAAPREPARQRQSLGWPLAMASWKWLKRE